MTIIDDLEGAPSGSRPVEVYKFSQGFNVWGLIGQGYPGQIIKVDAPGVATENTVSVVTREEIVYSLEETSGGLVVHLERDHPVAQLFVPFSPLEPVGLIIIRGFLDPLGGVVTDAGRVIWSGKVISASFDGPEARLNCQPIGRILRGQCPTGKTGSTCIWALYGPGCELNKDTHRDDVTLSAVSGASIQGAQFALRPDGWFTNGWVEYQIGIAPKVVQFVVNHVGNTLTLKAPLFGATAGTIVKAYWGCDRTEVTCDGKFDNLIRHAGWKRIPTDNPWIGRIV